MLIKNDWKLDYNKHQGWEVKGKNMGIIGLGSIGSRIAEIGKQIGMNVFYWSKNSRNNKFEYKELDELLKTSDFIFPALAKNIETQKILSKEKIDLIKANAFIVSITGQDLFDFDYVIEKIKEKKLAGLAMESEEKNMNDYQGNVYITPPIAWFTKEACEEDIRIWVENIVSCVKNKPQNII